MYPDYFKFRCMVAATVLSRIIRNYINATMMCYDYHAGEPIQILGICHDLKSMYYWIQNKSTGACVVQSVSIAIVHKV